MTNEVRTLTRWEKIIDEWIEEQTIHSRANVRGVKSEETHTYKNRFVLVETNLATVVCYYNGIPFPNPANFGTFFSPDAAERARENAVHFCQKYDVKKSDPLVLNVVTWTRQEEWRETIPSHMPADIFYMRTDAPAKESARVVYWASNSNGGFAAGDPCPGCQTPLKYEPGDSGTWDDPPQPDAVFCPFCGVEYGPIDWTRQK